MILENALTSRFGWELEEKIDTSLKVSAVNMNHNKWLNDINNTFTLEQVKTDSNPQVTEALPAYLVFVKRKVISTCLIMILLASLFVLFNLYEPEANSLLA